MSFASPISCVTLRSSPSPTTITTIQLFTSLLAKSVTTVDAKGAGISVPLALLATFGLRLADINTSLTNVKQLLCVTRSRLDRIYVTVMAQLPEKSWERRKQSQFSGLVIGLFRTPRLLTLRYFTITCYPMSRATYTNMNC
ncbi:145_t:CDS:2 [Ambispora gerdemannii]|uniref:145_t:CDS:1 n=1 Tax=Ambispora gerdemannii TaxID=144530 RepID=A0A9N9CYX5_9GLOM|nr:145_t:CDS:2 [Ambispora gerdemannii]